MYQVLKSRNFSTISNKVMDYKIVNKIAVVEFNNPSQAVNVINNDFSNQLKKILDVYDRQNLNGIIFKSGKKNNFIAGADISMISNSSQDELDKILIDGHSLIYKLKNINSVAAIDGSCLGGGLEFALACRYRIATDHSSTILGFPEVKLGLLPGMGGTQITPNLIGLKESLPYLLTGKNISPIKAKKLGLIDHVVDQGLIDKASLMIAENPKKKKKKSNLIDSILSKMILNYAQKDVSSKTKNLYPAPIKILEVLKNTYPYQNLYYEKDLFCELVSTSESKNLIKIFNDTNKLKEKYKNYNEEVKNIGIIGSGLMGTGIGKVSIDKTNILIKDNDEKNLEKSFINLNNFLETKLKKQKITNFEYEILKNKINSFDDLNKCDIVIEAVSENLDVKEKVFQELDKVCDKNTILASNTSSLSISEISKFSNNPERVIGMHYFSPVEKMPLLEIITHENNTEKVISKAISLGKKQNKTIIVVKDVPGFYINRCLAPYMNEAMHLLCEGYKPSFIDKIMTDKGFPVGPFTLMDEVGLDICYKVNEMLKNELDNRMEETSIDVTKILIDKGYLGKKTKKGFYDYKQNKKIDNKEILNYISEKNLSLNQTVDANVNSLLNKENIFERLLYKFINETLHCHHQKIIDSKIDGDIGAIYGCGFPPYLGGPFNYIDSIGKEKFYQKLNSLNTHYNRYNSC